jgi:hypothetical protein
MPLITRRSSTRGTPLGLFGSIGCKRAHCLSSNQNSPAISRSRCLKSLNQISARL